MIGVSKYQNTVETLEDLLTDKFPDLDVTSRFTIQKPPRSEANHMEASP